MVTVDEIRALREAASHAYWICERIRNIVVNHDPDWLADKIEELATDLKQHQHELGELCRLSLETVRQAAAIEKIPPFLLLDHELQTATEGSLLLSARHSLCFVRSDAAKVRDAVVSIPAIDFEAASNRVREEWAAAVRMLNAKPRDNEQGLASKPDATGAMVPASQIGWRDHFKTYKQFKSFLDTTPEIRRDSPRPNRLRVHAGDWAKYWANHDKDTFSSLDVSPEAIAQAVDRKRK